MGQPQTKIIRLYGRWQCPITIIYMNLWMKGYDGREVFSIKSPPCKAFRGNSGIPYEVEKAPYLTIAARQHGEAWNHPFVSVYEPSTEKEGRTIESIKSFDVEGVSADFVGLIVKSKKARTDYIFSSVKDEIVSYNGFSINGTYGVITEHGNDFTLFLGHGTKLSGKGFSIESIGETCAVLEYKNGEYYFTCDAPVALTTDKGKSLKVERLAYQKIKL